MSGLSPPTLLLPGGHSPYLNSSLAVPGIYGVSLVTVFFLVMWAGWGQLGSWLPVDDILCLGTHPIFTKISLGGNIAQQCLGCGMGLVGVGVTLQCSNTTLLVHILLLNFNAFETQKDVEGGGDLQISLPHPQSQLQPQFLCTLDMCTCIYGNILHYT
ncbi:hypothetical protein ILYODFUR_033685 [Ilyodon furcidens]|uniref:Uncharacterized protein n=1 Tax=Ilyodon furcidens TaxID=33524 RepID=A0ABV0TD87_9TELE